MRQTINSRSAEPAAFKLLENRIGSILQQREQHGVPYI